MSPESKLWELAHPVSVSILIPSNFLNLFKRFFPFSNTKSVTNINNSPKNKLRLISQNQSPSRTRIPDQKLVTRTEIERKSNAKDQFLVSSPRRDTRATQGRRPGEHNPTARDRRAATERTRCDARSTPPLCPSSCIYLPVDATYRRPTSSIHEQPIIRHHRPVSASEIRATKTNSTKT